MEVLTENNVYVKTNKALLSAYTDYDFFESLGPIPFGGDEAYSTIMEDLKGKIYEMEMILDGLDNDF